ncbi:MAG: carboxypeptidase-like regulatory domain-containing protein [Ferruginibacter sp.]
MIKLLRTVVFDTTAILLHANVADLNSNKPIGNAIVSIFNTQEKYSDTTDANGGSEIFRNLSQGKWTLEIQHADYYCLLVSDIIHSGGQWFDIKLRHY